VTLADEAKRASLGRSLARLVSALGFNVSPHRAIKPRAELACHHRFANRLGSFSNFRLAFNSARFLISALIFSIKVIASGVRILRVEFTCAPSEKTWRSAG
jgi:hypothetical protein